MTSREKILAAVNQNQPELLPLPDLNLFNHAIGENLVEQFTKVLEGIGGQVITVNSEQEIFDILQTKFDFSASKVVSPLSVFAHISSNFTPSNPHELADVDVVVLPSHFAVAENGACWVTEEIVGERALPFITQHLSLVVKSKDILATMHQAYQKISNNEYGFGVFIAGPSKTADIEQSLVLGAHGSRSLIVFLMGS
jgi:L-lactate dehydrogenase complex protein LldG